MLLATCFTALPALGAVGVILRLRLRGRGRPARPSTAHIIPLVLSGGWVVFCAGAWVYSVLTRSPNDTYCP